MRILLTGRSGQVGSELHSVLAGLGGLNATDRSTLDLADPDEVRRIVRQYKPDLIVNAGAYTAVDRAESERALAMLVNGKAPGVLAEEARRNGALMIHYSTDYVFDGMKGVPYVETDDVNPLSVYGNSKLQGELAVRDSGCRHLILRTAWVYGAQGGNNFIKAILRKARAGESLRVVNDQFGAPTWAFDIARLTADLLRLKEPPCGTFHATAAGTASWYEVAREALRLAGVAAPVAPIPSVDYPTPAPRPRYSVLDNSALARAAPVAAIGHWRDRLAVHLGAGDTKAK